MNIQIANRLLEYRRASGYSQEELAERLGVIRQAVSKWERAKASPDTDNLIALAELYGVTIDELINGSRRESAPEDVGATVDETSEEVASAEPEEDAEPGEDDEDDEHENGDYVHIGLDGIHVEDHKGNQVHIDLHGVHVDDDEGNHVHIGAGGAYVSEADKEANIMIKDGKLYVNGEYICDVDEDARIELHRGRVYLNGTYVCDAGDGDTVTVAGGHVYVNGRERKTSEVVFNRIDAIVPILAAIAYLVLGFLTPWGWRLGWLVFFSVPIIASLLSAIKHGKPSRFAYPVLVAGVYLFLGLWFGWWHPWWVMFLTIPLYYAICDGIERLTGRK